MSNEINFCSILLIVVQFNSTYIPARLEIHTNEKYKFVVYVNRQFESCIELKIISHFLVLACSDCIVLSRLASINILFTSIFSCMSSLCFFTTYNCSTNEYDQL